MPVVRTGRLGPSLPLIALVGLGLMLGTEPARGQGNAIQKGVAFLRSSTTQGAPNGGNQIGEQALAGAALLKVGVPATDPSVVSVLDAVRGRIVGGRYMPERSGGTDVYEAGVVCMFLGNLGNSYTPELQAVASHLISKQKSAGSWDYDGRGADTGDCSISQYAVLGLWEAANAGARVPPSVWEKAARWYMANQRGGGWTYHPDAGTPPTISMTAAGTGSLLICQRQLAAFRRDAQREKPPSDLLTPVVPLGPDTEYRVSLRDDQFEAAIEQGMAWIGRNFRPGDAAFFGPSTVYGFYGIERVGSLSKSPRLGAIDWYAVGSQYLVSKQGGNGAWNDQYGPLPSTAWAIMFLARVTEKTIAKLDSKKLGSGTLLGGRGLPEDLSTLTVAQGRVVVRPMNGAIEEMLAALEDPRAEGVETALSGLIDRYFTSGSLALRPYKDRFRALLKKGDVEQRQTAAWALSRTGELDVAPDLIEALEDPSDDVVATARYGLRLLRRDLDEYGPARGASPEEKQTAARQWRDWYEEVRPPELVDQIPGARAGR